MPVIQVPSDPHEQPVGLAQGNFSDVLFDVAVPEPEVEITPEEQRWMGFMEHAPSGHSHAGHDFHEPVVSRSEVCIFGGWPRRHIQIGAHCPHGMLEEDDDDGFEYQPVDPGSG